MIESSHGIILRTRPLTETSLIVHWLTPDLGRLATVAKGARRAKSPFAGRLDLFYEADFSFTRSRRSDLHTLREAGLRQTHAAIRDDVTRLHQAAYACGFIEQTTETESPIPSVFELLRTFLKQLSEQKPSTKIVLAFEIKMLRELGLEPDFATTSLPPGTQKIASLLSQKEFAALASLQPTRAQSGELQAFLHGFLIFHLDHLPRGRAAALADGM